MIKATLGLTHEPFHRNQAPLLPPQQQIAEILHIHAQHGGFAVILGAPGVGKTVLREHLEQRTDRGETIVASVSRTLHSYLNLLLQLADAFKLDAPLRQLESALIQTAYAHVRERKTLYLVIDEAHLLDIGVLRKLRLLFERFPKKHLLVLLGQPDLMHTLALLPNADIKSRITYSATLWPLADPDLRAFISTELDAVRLGANTFDEAALDLILRNAQGNLRLARHLCHGSLLEACRDGQRQVSIAHVNDVLIQPHWRSHEQLIKGQVK
ncbi:ExeA family protein [Pseudomarimonas arenosa]|uniref:AAA family ATPase n=1 Tax=Pseudomarimonas arenosa TaxID=2774145 RepID=A0AAW3ZQB2_9GAMM|nr:AAA family ATPase [Pseudomarimonas arenosa]MBD8528301.1 AAA family ATPase [Pseudomarimonas arenosa]